MEYYQFEKRIFGSVFSKQKTITLLKLNQVEISFSDLHIKEFKSDNSYLKSMISTYYLNISNYQDMSFPHRSICFKLTPINLF
jgi:hypothetical protein